MEKNGQHFSAIGNQVIGLIEHHIALLRLEGRYESEQAQRRLAIVGAVLLCGVAAYTLLLIALISLFQRLGVPLYMTCLAFAALHAAVGAYLYTRYGHRNPATGPPFQASGEELNRSLQWMHQLLS